MKSSVKILDMLFSSVFVGGFCELLILHLDFPWDIAEVLRTLKGLNLYLGKGINKGNR